MALARDGAAFGAAHPGKCPTDTAPAACLSNILGPVLQRLGDAVFTRAIGVQFSAGLHLGHRYSFWSRGVTVETKTCTRCGCAKPLHSFTYVRPGTRRGTCIQCRKATDTANNPERVRRESVRAWDKTKQLRRSGQEVARWILIDSRKSDRKKGRSNDLTREWIETAISEGCHYCGETTLRMTLDRKDNLVGHIRDNVVPACLRCNYARGAMPYAAWLCLVSGMQKARTGGLFGSWTGRCR